MAENSKDLQNNSKPEMEQVFAMRTLRVIKCSRCKALIQDDADDKLEHRYWHRQIGDANIYISWMEVYTLQRIVPAGAQPKEQPHGGRGNRQPA